MKKTLHISDTHGMHHQLKIPKDVEILIHSGDFGNSRDIEANKHQAKEFLDWFKQQPGIKILVPGNHDTCFEIEANRPEIPENITCLIHEEIVIEGLRIFGSPWTPAFGNGWVYNLKDANEAYEKWKQIPNNTDILITHGPPQGVLDLGINRRTGEIETCGDLTLKIMIGKLTNLKYHLFGHIHDGFGFVNHGTRHFSDITFSNGACVTDGHFSAGLTSKGNYFQL